MSKATKLQRQRAKAMGYGMTAKDYATVIFVAFLMIGFMRIVFAALELAISRGVAQ